MGALALFLAMGCDPAGTELERSCRGAEVELCQAAEWAELSEASLTPPNLRVADFSLNAQIHVALERCEDAPALHEVDLLVVVPDDMPGPDASLPVQVIHLLTLVDGAGGDAVAGDGIIDVDVVNPFIVTVPAETDVTLRFVARSDALGGCTSGTAEIPYRTGAVR